MPAYWKWDNTMKCKKAKIYISVIWFIFILTWQNWLQWLHIFNALRELVVARRERIVYKVWDGIHETQQILWKQAQCCTWTAAIQSTLSKFPILQPCAYHVLNFWARPTGVTLAKVMPATKREQVCIFNKFPRASCLVISLSVGQFQSVVSGLFRAWNATRSLLSLSPDIPHNLLDIPATSGCAAYPPSFAVHLVRNRQPPPAFWNLPSQHIYTMETASMRCKRLEAAPPPASVCHTLGGKHCEGVVPLRRSVFPQWSLARRRSRRRVEERCLHL